jgi:DNA-binding beta-propeller fold protein YncE
MLLLAAACGSEPLPAMTPPDHANPVTGTAGVSGTSGTVGSGGAQAGAMASGGQAAPSTPGASGGSGNGAGGMAAAGGAAGGGAGASGAAGMAGEPAPAVETVPTLYWLDINANRVMRSQDFTTGEAIVTRTGTAPDGVAVDVEGGKVYWTNMGSLLGSGGGTLQRANLDGSDVETIIPAGMPRTPKQMQLDLVNDKLYFCDREGAKVWRANLDGSDLEAIVSEHGFNQLVGVALDVPAGKFYFSDRNSRKILRANIEMPAGETGANRTDIEELLVFGSGAMPIDLDIDHKNGFLYWTDRDLATVNRAGLEIPAGETAMNRSDIETLVTRVVDAIGLSLDVENGKMYYSELGGQVSEAALDGSNARDILRSGSATGVAIAHLPKP